MKIYLAGPDVFLPDAVQVGARKKALCAAFGFEGLYPLDNELATPTALAIFDANCRLMRQADVGMFNLSPFRGPSADAGTAFEVGFLAALGKPLYGYSNNAALYGDRVEAAMGATRRNGGWWAADGMSIEDFGLQDNLMLDCAIERSGGAALARYGDGSTADMAAMAAFRQCLEKLAAERGRPK
ncbi:MAG: hypothetical protein GC160_09455 [Acidobacteria bacterium]|nr:hypothetical protein [Acidobacteriota bacterium]